MCGLRATHSLIIRKQWLNFRFLTQGHFSKRRYMNELPLYVTFHKNMTPSVYV